MGGTFFPFREYLNFLALTSGRRRFASPVENRGVVAGAIEDRDRVESSCVPVVSLQFQPQTSGFHANDGIVTLIVMFAAIEYVAANGVFLECVRFPRQRAIHRIRQESAQTNGVDELVAGQN